MKKSLSIIGFYIVGAFLVHENAYARCSNDSDCVAYGEVCISGNCVSEQETTESPVESIKPTCSGSDGSPCHIGGKIMGTCIGGVCVITPPMEHKSSE